MSRSYFRKSSLKRSISAKYKGAYKRKIKKALIPGYGTRAAGWAHPKRKLYNKIYHRTSYDTRKLFGYNPNQTRKKQTHSSKPDPYIEPEDINNKVSSIIALIYDLLSLAKTACGFLGIITIFFLPNVAAWLIAAWIILWIVCSIFRSLFNVTNVF